jgi:hypothetical protein
VLIKRSAIFRKISKASIILWCLYLFYTSFVIVSVSACVLVKLLNVLEISMVRAWSLTY